MSAKKEPSTYPAYVTKWTEAMREEYTLASKSAQKAAAKVRRQSDKRVRLTILVPGDRVLVRNLTPRRGTGKIRAFWEDEFHIVVSRKNADTPVYDVKSESGRGQTRKLHRNLLLPCDYLPVNTLKLNLDMKRRKKLTPTPPRTSTNDNHEPDLEGEEEASFAPKQIDALVKLQPNGTNQLMMGLTCKRKRQQETLKKIHPIMQLVHRDRDNHLYALVIMHRVTLLCARS